MIPIVGLEFWGLKSIINSIKVQQNLS